MIVQSFSTHYAVVRVKAELDQILEGLATLDVLDLIRSNPIKMRTLLVHSNAVPLTADMMLDMCQARLSPVGANRREAEEEVVMQWVKAIESKSYTTNIYSYASGLVVGSTSFMHR